MKLIYFSPLFILALVSCASTSGEAGKRGALKGTPITFEIPVGFEDTTSEITTPVPVVRFQLPEEADHGRRAYPMFLVSRISDYEGNDMRAYVAREMPKDSHDVHVITSHTVSVDGRAGYEFAFNETDIYDLANGTAATGTISKYQIVFKDGDAMYHCYMESYPGADPKYLQTFERFCSSLRFTKQ